MRSTSTTSRTKIKRRLSAEDRRKTILLAASNAFVEGGSEAVSMERVAAMIGISRAVLYDHFPSRSALLAAMHDDYAEYVNGTVAAALADTPEDLEGLAWASVRGFFDAVGERGVLHRAVRQAAGNDPELLAAHQRTHEQAITAIAIRLSEYIDVTPKRLRPAGAMIMALFEQAATLWLSGELKRADAEQLYVTMAVPALRAIEAANP